jgi:GxxExxY protein
LWFYSSRTALLAISKEDFRFFRGVEVGKFIPDLIAFGSVIVDTKVIDRITDHERGQMMNYLRITKLRVGLILNFQHARLEWERVVL